MGKEKKKILIAEDEKSLRTALSDRLSQEEDVEVFEAGSGDEALEKAEKELPDLMVMDIYMPGKTGLEAYQDMQEEDWASETSVIFLTNSSSLSQVAFAQEYGPVDYLIKSDWDLEDIIAKIKENL